MKIGLLLIATGKYDRFVFQFLESVNKHFFNGQDVTVYLFSDKHIYVKGSRLKIVNISIEHKPFPYATLLRYKHFDEYKEKFDCDYLFYSDVDMKFVSDVGEEILNDGLTAVQHPGFYERGWGSNNVDVLSNAWLPVEKRIGYCAGGFQGGKKEDYLTMCNILNARIQDDESRGVMAEWHDESHWNWYLKTLAINAKVLNPSYCFPEASWAKNMPFEKKLMALDKNHEKLR